MARIDVQDTDDMWGAAEQAVRCGWLSGCERVVIVCPSRMLGVETFVSGMLGRGGDGALAKSGSKSMWPWSVLDDSLPTDQTGRRVVARDVDMETIFCKTPCVVMYSGAGARISAWCRVDLVIYLDLARIIETATATHDVPVFGAVSIARHVVYAGRNITGAVLATARSLCLMADTHKFPPASNVACCAACGMAITGILGHLRSASCKCSRFCSSACRATALGQRPTTPTAQYGALPDDQPALLQAATEPPVGPAISPRWPHSTSPVPASTYAQDDYMAAPTPRTIRHAHLPVCPASPAGLSGFGVEFRQATPAPAPYLSGTPPLSSALTLFLGYDSAKQATTPILLCDTPPSGLPRQDSGVSRSSSSSSSSIRVGVRETEDCPLGAARQETDSHHKMSPDAEWDPPVTSPVVSASITPVGLFALPSDADAVLPTSPRQAESNAVVVVIHPDGRCGVADVQTGLGLGLGLGAQSACKEPAGDTPRSRADRGPMHAKDAWMCADIGGAEIAAMFDVGPLDVAHLTVDKYSKDEDEGPADLRQRLCMFSLYSVTKHYGDDDWSASQINMPAVHLMQFLGLVGAQEQPVVCGSVVVTGVLMRAELSSICGSLRPPRTSVPLTRECSMAVISVVDLSRRLGRPPSNGEIGPALLPLLKPPRALALHLLGIGLDQLGTPSSSAAWSRHMAILVAATSKAAVGSVTESCQNPWARATASSIIESCAY